MNLKDYIDTLNKFVNENPDALDYEVITTREDGWSYIPMIYPVTVGNYEWPYYTKENDIKDLEYQPINAICVG